VLVPVGPQRQPYPKTTEEAAGTPWAEAHELHGSRDVDRLFQGHPRTTAPWPKPGRKKGERLYQEHRVHAALANPSAHMREMDPRHLHANQPWVTHQGVSYYMGERYHETGETFADMHVASNRWPIVYSDTRGRNIVLSGHHRATAALLRGEQFRALHIEE
jgi:hypothetical protein